MRHLIIAGLSLAATCFSSPAGARVERIEILSRQAFAAGTEFGHAGSYEKLRGRAFFALDPDAAANGPIADLKLAPRNNRGLVEFSAEFLVLRPTDVARRNGTLLYEVNNRGNIGIFYQLNEAPFNNDPATQTPATVFCFAMALPWCGRRGFPMSRRRQATIGWCCVRRLPPRTACRSRARSPTS